MTYATRAASMPDKLTGKDKKPVDAEVGEDPKEEAAETPAEETTEMVDEAGAKPKKKQDFAEVQKGAPMGNKNAAGPHGGGNYTHKPGANIVAGLDAVTGGLKKGRNSIANHPVDATGGNHEEGVSFRGVDKEAATGAIKHLRSRGFPVKRHDDHEFTVG